MEGETFEADLSRLLHVIEKLRRADGLEVFPFLLVDAMHQIEIDVVGLEFLQFLVKHGLHLCTVMHQLRRHLGRDRDLVAVAVLKSLAHYYLGSLVQIDICGINIGHSAVNRAADQRDGLLLVYNAVSRGRAVKAHAAKAER